jgi:mevalonate pyrophosphate decarboxylase
MQHPTVTKQYKNLSFFQHPNFHTFFIFSNISHTTQQHLHHFHSTNMTTPNLNIFNATTLQQILFSHF